MAQWLRTHVLAEAEFGSQHPHDCLTNIYNSNSMGFDSAFGPSRAPDMNMM